MFFQRVSKNMGRAVVMALLIFLLWQQREEHIIRFVSNWVPKNVMKYPLVVEPTPLKNMSSPVGMMTFPIYRKNQHVPNHQPA